MLEKLFSDLFVPILVLVGAYQWLVCYLLKESAAKLRQELSNEKVHVVELARLQNTRPT